MKEIIFKNNDSEVLIDSNLSYYLFSKFFMYFLEDDSISKKYIISENKIQDLNNILENYLNEILRKWYKEPDEKELQKYSTRFEKIKFNTKIYKVNYRMSEIGRLVFLVYNLLKMLNDSYINRENLSIIIKDCQ
ncbi:hypothetical protein [Chryseobacterium sp. LAM-KRS1]|uniref:hypothetical protein n=1 Tax=Chryseobacterium sp. LAM-KRS1 TaxID=2715754 RepID=UPI001554F395|nr:hypothetical protein [Chryseobacterium sp. LAM-KRS1]